MSLADELTEKASRVIPPGIAEAIDLETRWFIDHCKNAAANGKFEFTGIITRGDVEVVAGLVAVKLTTDYGLRAKVVGGQYVYVAWGPVSEKKPWWSRWFGKSLPKAKVVK